jgi:glycerophosphoryl diester phosphodiesterase
MIEFDVLPERTSQRLILAHDYRDAAKRTCSTLEEGLDHLGAERFDGVELDVDLKLPGYEERVLDALRARNLLERSLICSQYTESLPVLRRVAPEVRVGWSVPKVTRDPFRSPFTAVPAYGALQVLRRVLPARAAAAVRAGRCHAVMAHWRLVTPRLVTALAKARGELYVWTVDDREQIARLERMGVTGVITNDPRLFV